MGNNNSSRQQHMSTYRPHHPPVGWTQSFPRDHKRIPKVSANKVLPPPTSAKLRPTENGRSLHVAGTISGRRVPELNGCGPQSLPGYASPCLAHPHGPPSHLSTSLTHLHHPPCAVHNLSPRISNSPLRFGAPPSKVYTSEPDLRSNGAPSLPPSSGTPHTIISQSPTKGRIKSKKRNKAPPPPASGALSDGGERGVHWGATDTAPSSRPPSQASRRKGGGGGLFKKKNESRKSDAESSFMEDSHSGRPLYRRMDSSPAVSSREVKEDRRERARSVDCLQHELRTRGVSAETREHTKRNGDGSSDDTSADTEMRRRSQTIEREGRRAKGGVERRLSTTLERKVSHNSPEKSEDSRFPYLNGAVKVHPDKRFEKAALNRAFDEWEEAEKELIERKKRSDNMRNELQTAAKNLRKIDKSPQIRTDDQRLSQDKIDNENPKTFFFGMAPPNEKAEEIRINGNSVEYSKRETSSRISNEINTKNSPNVRQVPLEVEDFVFAMERQKRENNINQNDQFVNSSLRREDGGYHSRQNSGSFRLENSATEITANLRPILPKRQREIPRFSPNAAWKFLGEEPFLSEENLNESRSSDDIIYEDKIRGYARPIAPPRGSGEKSADSGISGDAGSPGPMPEFEPIKLVRRGDVVGGPNVPWRGAVVNGGPLAASSPMVSGDLRRAWTPAQDLDDNSLEGSAEVTAESNGLSAPPKLQERETTRTETTTRTSMFDIFPQQVNEINHNNSKDSTVPAKLTSRNNMFTIFGNDASITTANNYDTQQTKELIGDIESHNKTSEGSTQTPENNFRKLKRSVSSGFNIINSNQYSTYDKKEEKSIQNDKWRDNWSMSRSIPHSLNEEPIVSNNSKDPSEAAAVVGSGAVPPSYKRLHSEGSRSNSSYPLQNGHIVYLPEYNSQLSSPDMVRTTSKTNINSSSASGDMVVNITSRELNSSRHLKRDDIVMAPAVPRWGKKNKKFSYQSTVRVLEKKKIEEVLNREVAEKERRRLQEVAAMKQVEQEFQMKREREKKKLKQQLKIYQVMNGDAENPSDSVGENIIRDLSSSHMQWREELDDGPIGEKANGRESPISTSSPPSDISTLSRRMAASRHPPDGAPSLSSPRQDALTSARARNGFLTTLELAEYQQPRREYREYRRSERSKEQTGVGDNYRRDFSRGQTQTLGDDKLSRSSTEGHKQDMLDTSSTCSTASTSIIRVVRGKPTKYFEHPPATGNMAPANGSYKLDAFNRHLTPTHS